MTAKLKSGGYLHGNRIIQTQNQGMREREKAKTRREREAQRLLLLLAPPMRRVQQLVSNRLQLQHSSAAPGPRHSSRAGQMSNPIAQP